MEASTLIAAPLEGGASNGPQKRDNYVLLGTSAALGLIVNYLFFDKLFGISYPVFICFTYIYLVYNLRGRLTPVYGPAVFLTVPAAALSLSYFLFSNSIFQALNFLAIPLLLLAQTLLAARRNKFSWHSPYIVFDLLHAIFIRTLGNIPKPFYLLGQLLSGRHAARYGNFKKILTGLFISIPLLAVVISLLMSADSIFEYYLNELPHIFRDINTGEIAARIFIIAFVTIVMFSYVWSLLNKESGFGPVPTVKAEGFRIWDPVTVLTVFAAVNLVYLFFTAVQFSYLFGSFSLKLPESLTYAEYARRGFFELILVTIINLGLLLVGLYLTRKGSGTQELVNRLLYTLLVGCTFVMLVSAHLRMSMYEEVYGYTYLRMLTHSFMAFLFVLFLIMLYRIWREHALLMKPFIITALAAYLIVNYMNMDVLIAGKNLERYRNTGKIDVKYLTTLSYDAIPELIKLKDDKNPEVAGAVSDYLSKTLVRLQRPEPWPSFNLSRYRALKALEK